MGTSDGHLVWNGREHTGGQGVPMGIAVPIFGA